MGLVNSGRWPLVVVRWPTGLVSDGEVQEVLGALTACYGRQHAVLHDGVRAGGLTGRQRQMFERQSALHEEDIRRWVIASAAAAPSPLVRTLIRTIQWVTPAPCPFQTFADAAEAEEWLMQALRRAGVWRPTPRSTPLV